MQIPANYDLLFDRDTISTAISKLVTDINIWADLEHTRSSKQILLIAPMYGAIIFAADLIREIQSSVEIRTVTASSYLKNQRGSSVVIDQWDFSLKDRFVVVIDEVCDSGRTLTELTALASSCGAFTVKSVALIFRETSTSSFKPDLIGLTFSGKEWLVGYGMDDNENFRNLAQIYKKRVLVD